MGMECIIHVMDYTCYVSVKHTCIDMGDYLRGWLYLEGVRRRTPPPRLTKLAAGGLKGGATDTFVDVTGAPMYSWNAQASRVPVTVVVKPL